MQSCKVVEYSRPQIECGIKKRIKGHDLIVLKSKDLPDDALILGVTKFKRVDANASGVNKLVIGDRYYQLDFISENSTEKGIYLPVGDNEFVRIKRGLFTPLFLIALCLIVIGAGIWVVGRTNYPGNDLDIADGDDISNIPEDSEVIDYETYIELPYLSTIEVKSNPVPLINPENNTVYMGFKILYNDETIYESEGAVRPGEFLTWDARQYFKNAGNYNVVIVISTYDVETREECSSANIESVVTIK